ncbi:MAG TPA: GGDEF domain-containing protein [Polyangia bacterium]|nr:GGDEF domain-containing protein [Polyangia bacterium]
MNPDKPETTYNTDQVADRSTPLRKRDKSCLFVLSGSNVGEMYSLEGGRTVIGRGEQVAVRIVDDGISRAHAAIESDGACATLVDLGSTNGTFCNGDRVSRRELADGDKIALGASTILKFMYQDDEEARLQRQLYESALRDSLTSSFNRRFFLDRLRSEMAYAKRHQKALAVLFMDLDHFKKINDTYGHPAGDKVLVEVSQVIRSLLRAEDVFARYGGEEFVIACRGIELKGAEILAARILDAVRRAGVEHAGRTIALTVSIGVAVYGELSEVETLIAAADAAMYEAKQRGRDQSCSHVPRPPTKSA